ncbi:MAG: hypothetical protein PF542_04520 [Nanoarchaeota archaeon]|jgi:hypothetical protein|nr:hypothetical protein [Nanoarchaeota archaeon]
MSNRTRECMKKIINLEKGLIELKPNTLEAIGPIKDLLVANQSYIYTKPNSIQIAKAEKNVEALMGYFFNKYTLGQTQDAYKKFSEN